MPLAWPAALLLALVTSSARNSVASGAHAAALGAANHQLPAAAVQPASAGGGSRALLAQGSSQENATTAAASSPAGTAGPAQAGKHTTAAVHKTLSGKPKARHGPCRPDDARCIALRDHVCDPYYVQVEDKCTFVQYNRHCAADVHHVAYLPLFYCRHGDGRVFVALFFLFWMGVLFWMMAAVAEDFLVPALEYLAYWLRLAPDVAGVTLFAFASGAPDLFTQIAAVAVGGTVDQELAISATLGGGLFIIAVIFSVVVLVRKKEADGSSNSSGGNGGLSGSSISANGGAGSNGVIAGGSSGGGLEITDRRAFVRDCVAYLLSTLALLGLMLRGTFTAWEAGLLLLGYGAYLATCVLTSRRGEGGAAGGGSRHHQYFPASTSQHQLQQGGGGGGAGALALLPAPLGGPEVAANGMQQQQQPTPRAQVELVSRVGGPQPQRKPSRVSHDTSAAASLSASPLRGKQQQQPHFSAADLESAALVAGMPLSDASASPRNGSAAAAAAAFSVAAAGGGVAGVGATLTHSTGRALAKATSGIEGLLHTKGKSGPRLWLTLLMSPAMLLLHLTMPALHAGHFTMWYGLLLALTAPAFTLVTSELYPHRLSTPQFLLAWLLSALVLFILMLAVRPSGSSSSSGGMQALPSNGTLAAAAAGSTSPLAAGSTSPLSPGSINSGGGRWLRPWGGSGSSGPAGVCGSLHQMLAARRPRRCVLLAVLAAVQCMLWMSVAADELVALFQAIGRICDISQDLLGATVLAWGEAVPELVATMSLARQGQATMAIAAVFGGPIFNILIAWAGPTLYAALRKDPELYTLSAGVSLLVGFTVLILSFSLVAFPLVFRWRLARKAAICILLIYALSQLLFLIIEQFL